MSSALNSSANTNLPAGYNPPGVFTQTSISFAQPIISGSDKVEALIGVSDETRTAVGVEMIRGSSATQDNPIYGEDVSNQANGLNTTFTVNYPIVTGSGQGILSTDPTTVTVYDNGVPVNVLAVNGATRSITLQDPPVAGDVVTVDYFFKKKDTYVANENHTQDVPLAPKLAVKISASSTLYLSLTNTGSGANFNTANNLGTAIEFISSAAGSADYAAIQGNGTDLLIVDIALPPIVAGQGTAQNPSTNYRTSSQLATLISTYGFTLSGGSITASYVGLNTSVDPSVLITNAAANAPSQLPLVNGQLPLVYVVGNTYTASVPVVSGDTYAWTVAGGTITAGASTNDITFTANSTLVTVTCQVTTNQGASSAGVVTVVGAAQVFGFYGGQGQNSSTTFQVDFLPIVDGTNGGVITTSPSNVSVLVNSQTVPVASVDGLHGLVTLANPVPEGATLYISYYYNTYQNTADILPKADALSVQQCGYSARGNDFIVGTDFALANNAITWGNAATVQPLSTTQDTTPFGSQATVQVYDNQVFLLQTVQGACNGHNILFTLPQVPVDGTATGNATDIPTSQPGCVVQAYVGPDPYTAYTNGPVNIVRVTGSTSQIMLQTAPASNNNVYVTFLESLVSDSTVTLTCATSGPAEVGSYTAVSSNGKVPTYAVASPEGNLLATRPGWVANKIVFPHGDSDLMGIPGSSPAEVITLTFVSPTQYKVTSSRTVANTQLDGFGVTGGSTTPTTQSGTAYTATAGTAILNTNGTPKLDSHGVAIYSNSVLDSSGNQVMNASQQPVYVDSAWLNIGADGYLNQTYVDANTGVRFTILNPNDAATNVLFGYTNGVNNIYTFQVGDQIQFTCTLGAPIVTGDDHAEIFIPGVKMTVDNVLGVTVGDTAQVTTFSKSGNQPSVGDNYYVSYTYAKPASAYDFQVYYNTQEQQVYNDYGYPSPTNALALAAWIAFRNNAKVVGLLQVKKDQGLNTASDSKYVAALTSLQTLYPGMTRKPQIIVPLTTSPTFVPYLTKFVETQSSVKMAGECVGFFGFPNNTNPATAINTVQQIGSERMVAVYPDGGVITITDSYGNSRDVVVDGSIAAAAFAALYADPEWDVATPRTRKPIVGFKSLYRNMDVNTANAVAQAGCSIIEQRGATFRVRHALTTDTTNVLTVQPSITFLADTIQADIRDLLDPFIGQKFLDSTLTDMRTQLVSYFKSRISAELIQTYGSITVTRDPNDSRVAQVAASYVPVGELTYIFVNLFISSTAS